MSETTPAKRLASLDILRGLDLFLLVFLQPVIVAFASAAQIPELEPLLRQLDHEVWNGFRFWDLIMPLFLFITGASMPFSLRKQAAGGKPWGKILRRVAILYLLGGVVQGNFLGLDPQRIYLLSNTLQAIAAGYLIAALIQLHLRPRYQLLACGILLLIYWLPMTFCGDLTPHGNFADMVDQAILGRFRDGTRFIDGIWVPDPGYTYTWIWSSLTFAVTVMMGVFAGRMLKENPGNGVRNTKLLLLWGAGCIAVALLWSLQMPINKRIWSCSMTLLSGGYCFLLLGAFYYLIDCKGYLRGAEWLKIYGMNSIAAYMLGEAVNFRCIVHSLTYGLEQWTGDYYPALLTLGNYLIVLAILALMYRRRIFLKI